jgi:glutamyl/glutaminyl-tRNA synthetase
MSSGSPSPVSGYRGRLAPSPTGYLHLGHARTFWTAYERAKAAGGALVLRIEDLDPDRSRQAYAEAACEDLRWLGIRWQEGPGREGFHLDGQKNDGPFAPYLQSQRHSSYLAAWRKLLDGGFIYPCRCSRKDLAAALNAPHESASCQLANGEIDPLDDEPVYPGTCRPILSLAPQLSDPAGIEIEKPLNWRFRVPDGEAIEFEDLNLGPQRFVAGRDFGDFVVWRRDGVPSYQLACVADDAAMRITEVVRGEDLLKSTARQILLHRALGVEAPAWFHCRLVVDKGGIRLAKRHDTLSLRVLRQRGFSPGDVLQAELPIHEISAEVRSARPKPLRTKEPLILWPLRHG